MNRTLKKSLIGFSIVLGIIVLLFFIGLFLTALAITSQPSSFRREIFYSPNSVNVVTILHLYSDNGALASPSDFYYIIDGKYEEKDIPSIKYVQFRASPLYLKWESDHLLTIHTGSAPLKNVFNSRYYKLNYGLNLIIIPRYDSLDNLIENNLLDKIKDKGQLVTFDDIPFE